MCPLSVYINSPGLTVALVADGAPQSPLTLGGLPEAVGVLVHTGAAGGLWGPTAEHCVAAICPAKVDPALNTWETEELLTSECYTTRWECVSSDKPMENRPFPVFL